MERDTAQLVARDTNYKSCTINSTSKDTSLAEELNHFFTCLLCPKSSWSVRRNWFFSILKRVCHLPSIQYAYQSNRSTDAITIAMHTALCHLEHNGTHVRMLFIDFSFAFNTILPDILTNKLLHLGLPTTICTWMKDFLTNWSQNIRLSSLLSSSISLSSGAPQSCVLSPLLCSL